MNVTDYFNLMDVEYLIRILIAAVCGGAVGFERGSRMKMAGTRTHLIVSMAAALMMIVSKYGFHDILGLTGVGMDPSRIAAGAVTAIGFLGAGVIFVRKQNVSGITTAAGIWATVGIGLAIGAGLYFIGVITAILIVLIQVLLHRKTKLVREPISGQITLVTDGRESIDEILSSLFETKKIEINGLRVQKLENGRLEAKLIVRYPKMYEIDDIIQILTEMESVHSIEI